jgi:hypothetical protein
MPAIKIPGPYTISFWSNENDEPAHVHVRRENKDAKFWLGPVHLAENHGYARHELNKNQKTVSKT